jgi:hypothetical protein
MDYLPLIAIGISVFSLVIAGLSFWNSWRARHSSEDAHHDIQIVKFEQRKQELRQFFLEEEILHAEIDNELNRLPDSKWLREQISCFAIICQEREDSLKEFDAIPASPSAEERLRLEQIGGKIIATHKATQTFLKVLRDQSAALRRQKSPK